MPEGIHTWSTILHTSLALIFGYYWYKSVVAKIITLTQTAAAVMNYFGWTRFESWSSYRLFRTKFSMSFLSISWRMTGFYLKEVHGYLLLNPYLLIWLSFNIIRRYISWQLKQHRNLPINQSHSAGFGRLSFSLRIREVYYDPDSENLPTPALQCCHTGKKAKSS